MAGQRTITAQVNRPDGSGWANAEFRFIPLTNSFTLSPDATYPRDTKVAITDSEGQLEVTLASGLETAYQVVPPDDEPFTIIVEDGATTSLEIIRAATEGAPIPQVSLESRVDTYLAGIGAGQVGVKEAGTTILAAADMLNFSALFDVTNEGSGQAGVTLVTTPQPAATMLTLLAALADPNANRVLVWDDTANTFVMATIGSGLTFSGGALAASPVGFVQARHIITAPVAFTGVAATLVDIGSAFTIPANDAVVGKVYRITARGLVSNSAGAGRTFQLHVRLGGATIATSPTINLAAGASNFGWSLRFDLVVITTGATGTAEAQGERSVNGVLEQMSNTGVVAMNTTISRTLGLAFTAEATTVTGSMREFVIESMSV